MSDFEQIGVCPACAGAFTGEVVTGNAMFFTLEDGSQKPANYHHCSVCGLWALSPRYSDEFLKGYYSGEYREARPITANTLLWQKARAIEQMKLAGHLVTGKTVLEIGSSSGYLMSEFYRRGFTCTGVDPDPDSGAAYPDLSDVPATPFDMICMSHVFEHFNHPRAVMGELVNLYAHKGTRIMVDVPNYPTCKEAGLYQFHHPLLFDLTSLTRLMESVGCKVVFSAIHGDGGNDPNNLLVVGEVL